MNTHDKKHSFFNGSLAFFQAKAKRFLSLKMKLLTLFLSLFSGLFLNIKAYTQQVPVKPKVKVAVVKPTLPLVAKGKAKKVKKVIIKKDTIPEIDPANVSSPLYNKN